ncbi:MAG: GNAT family N-acetyltransferase [Thermoanaerobaculia bacterium]
MVALRPASPADAAILRRWRDEGSVGRHQPLGDVTTAQLRAELAGHRPEALYRGSGEKFQWIVTVDRQPAGWITLVVTNWDHGLAEFGYALATDYQRRGLMAPAIEQLLADLFLNTDIERLEARCSVDNVASQKVLERLGFRHEGLLRGYFRLRGERVDNHLYAMLREDYLALSPR